MKFAELVENYIATVAAYTLLSTTITRTKVQALDFEGRTALEKQEMQLMQTNEDFLAAVEVYEKLKSDKSIMGMLIESYKDDKEALEQIDLSFFLERRAYNVDVALQAVTKLADKGDK